MRNCIIDEFTHLAISRQRKYQLRMQRDKRCTECGEPAAEGSRCLKHLVKARERQRKNGSDGERLGQPVCCTWLAVIDRRPMPLAWDACLK